MERSIYLSRLVEWNELFIKAENIIPRQPSNKITHCAICLELLRGEKIKIFHKKKYKNVSKCERFNRLHRGLSAYPPADKLRELKCYHKFHKNCIEKWFKRSRTCPLCRK